jgi:hypothetical protein
MSKSIASSITNFAFETLLMQAIESEKLDDGKGTEDDPSEGTGFEPVGHAGGSGPSSPPSPSPYVPSSPPPLPNVAPASMADDSDHDHEWASDGDKSTSTTGKQKRRSKSAITYRNLVFKRRRAADRKCAKDDAAVKVRPSIRE